ncbi:DEAD/DEAH box helicase [Campylobacter suis]|uniref:Transcription-repair-coupling factor n=1 Tax=Campylobacter suis TaxID=2790657 RepID=A0ABN7K4D8_9BACT|nr:DEAD/DEAH box helicase [Campylobacter suis]CAD7287262.1 Transcription-repair-coupling factor [Campylobacter suis]
MQEKVYEYFLGKNSTDILICQDDKSARECADAASLAGLKTFVLPDFRARFGDDLRSFNEELVDISKILSDYYKCNDKKLIVSPYSTLLNPLPSSLQLKSITINFGDKIDINALCDELLFSGYEIVDIAESRGEFSVRGEVIDIFSLNHDEPVRILLFDDEVESIRNYDISTQISSKAELESIEVVPFLAKLSKNEYEKANEKLQDINTNAIVSDLNSLGFWAIDGFENYLEKFHCVLAQEIKEIDDERDLSVFKNFSVLPQAKEFKPLLASPTSDFFEINKHKDITVLARNESLFSALNVGNENVKLLISPLVVNLTSPTKVIISLNKFSKKTRAKKASLVVDELKVNDYVVHEEYGIGKFLGLEKITVLGATKEFVVIAYQNDDRLLLPVENLNLIDRYIAVNGSIAVLDRLGKASFAKIKEKVREKLFLIASKIIAMAAQRELVQGLVIQKDDAQYLKFLSRAGFEYTTDQLTAVGEISDELKSGRVMDRLLSGDVGFGKTEVAMNAIFKCVLSGFVALFFVPTTLLSSQHFKSLKERLAEFDIKVFRLDRFSSAKQKAEVTKALSDGEPCVCVGTHALLSQKAKNVGLIVVDEEHKFGVKQKEKLKEISSNSHVLSMSATPIPRSLNMALSKIKTYSVLKTPPSERLDVRTSVKEWDEKIIKEAIMREMRCGGQVFYIHNHIADIELCAKNLRKILPNLRILILHSKIDAKITEEEILKFENGEYDVMVCTSIVESGIHLPNANTMIVENANKFGIADLHQLRGRVGRSNKQGFCYFLVEDKNELTPEALKRLVALESNSALGSGSVLAYHDLEIRGGGNIIGEAQSGHIEAIGYSLYLKMLEDEINSLLNQQSVKLNKIDLKLSVNAFLNPEFIREDRLRLELYRRLSKAVNVNEVYDISGEIEDRFGKLDSYTKQFLDIIIIKILALKHGFKAISNAEQNIVLTNQKDEKIRLKSRSKDDDDVIGEIISHLRSLK